MKRECVAGLTTFFTILYAFIVVPTLLAEGGFSFATAQTSTLGITMLTTLFLAFYANYPFVTAPGLSILAYFVHILLLKDKIPLPIALGMGFFVGLALFLLNIFGLRVRIVALLPPSLRIGITAGLGSFLIVLGFRHLSSLTPSLLTLVGFLVTSALLFYRIPGAYFWGILFLSLLAACFGLTSWQGFFALPELPSLHFPPLGDLFHSAYLLPWLSLFCLVLFDSTAAVVALTERAQLIQEEKKRLPRLFFCDAVGSMMGALCGLSPLSYYLDSVAGIAAGGRSGLTAASTALFLLPLFFFLPLLSSIPLFATTPVLLLVGASMLFSLKSLPWKDSTEVAPALLTALLIPLTSHIALSVVVGYISYFLMKRLPR